MFTLCQQELQKLNLPPIQFNEVQALKLEAFFSMF